MTVVIQIRDGDRYTCWNVVAVSLDAEKAVVTHTDRPNTIVRGDVTSIVRR